jgi:hypothetical protein
VVELHALELGEAMSGLVDQLQADAMDENVSLTILLRKVKVAAVKLGLPDTLDWVASELDGYSSPIPDYRMLVGQLQWLNPMRGWLPVGFDSEDWANALQTWPVPESVSTLEATLASNSSTYT